MNPILRVLIGVTIFSMGFGHIITLAVAEEQTGRISADNYLYYAYDTKAKKPAFKFPFEDWATVTIGYGPLEANLIYEAHLPAPLWSADVEGYGFYEKTLAYKWKNLTLTAGNYYAMFGKGLTLRSFRNKDLRYNSNIEGFQAQFSNELLDVTAVAGTPRDFTGERFNALQGAEVRITPVPWGFWGGTYVRSHKPLDPIAFNLASGYMQLQRDFGSIYMELATRDVADSSSSANLFNSKGTSFYSTENAFFGKVTMLLETAYYNNFDFSKFNLHQETSPLPDTLWMLNSPPPGFKEHTTSLMSRVQPAFSANNHVSLHAEATYAISDEDNVSLCISRARKVDTNEQGGVSALINNANFGSYAAEYMDIYGKGEFVFPSSIDWSISTGWQRTIEADYLNFAATNDVSVRDNYSVQGGFEHQLEIFRNNHRMLYAQIYSITFSSASAPRLSAGFIGEFLVEPGETKSADSKITKWLGTQINYTFRETNDIVLFVGNRKAGKVCSGGVCVYKPEFSGVELTVISKF